MEGDGGGERGHPSLMPLLQHPSHCWKIYLASVSINELQDVEKYSLLQAIAKDREDFWVSGDSIVVGTLIIKKNCTVVKWQKPLNDQS